MPGEDRPSVKKPAQWLLLYTLKVLEFFGILPQHIGGTTSDAGSDVRSAFSGHARTEYGWQWMWCMPHMLHCALVQSAVQHVLGQPCVCGARLLGSHGSAVSAIVAGVD